MNEKMLKTRREKLKERFEHDDLSPTHEKYKWKDKDIYDLPRVE